MITVGFIELGTPCIAWDDDFGRVVLGDAWELWSHPDETLSDPSSGYVLPVIDGGALVSAALPGNGGDPSNALYGAAARVEGSDCDCQILSVSLTKMFQLGGGGAFRSLVFLSLFADPDTGEHVKLLVTGISPTGVFDNNHYLSAEVRYYYGPTGSAYETVSGGDYFVLLNPAPSSATVYDFEFGVCRSTGRAVATLDGVTIIDELAPIALSGGTRQALTVGWVNNTAGPGPYVSPEILSASGGGDG